MSTVLVIEDEPDLRRVLQLVLTRDGHVVVDAADGHDGLRKFAGTEPDLVLLDIGLPGIDGWEVLERIRTMSTVPIVLLTARGVEADKVRGLHAGADDYVTKPFGRAELLARVHAALRRGALTTRGVHSALADGPVQVDLVGRRAMLDGEELDLTVLEYRLLVALLGRIGDVLSLRELLDMAWDDPTGVGPDRVKFAVMRLRRKLAAHDPGFNPIEAVRGVGYCYRPTADSVT